MTGAYLAAEPNESPSHRLSNSRIVHYARLIYPESSETDHLWLMLLDLLGTQTPESDTVGATSLLQRRQSRQFVSPHSHHQLSATASGYTLFGAEAVHRFQPGAAHPRLEGPRFVVETGMDDAAVVPRLVPGEPVFRLEHDRGMPTLSKSESCCDADDSAPNHCSPIAI